ncbi:MAG TPA: hypothetical protein VMV22_09345 [Acidimicrobiales bacterium]|nr:hypothetical protein [Acidimicrobiales bacterium]
MGKSATTEEHAPAPGTPPTRVRRGIYTTGRGAAAAEHAAEAAEAIRRAPHLHKPQLVVSRQVRGNRVLDKIADAVNTFCGSMWVFLFITVSIVVWLFAGNVVGFDKTPWPLLLTILNLPQLSIMVSLQVSANRAQTASDARAVADHETLIALHAMATHQLDILEGQNKILAILRDLSTHDIVERQKAIVDTQEKMLAILDKPAPGG